jgi:hypothetical protein
MVSSIGPELDMLVIQLSTSNSYGTTIIGIAAFTARPMENHFLKETIGRSPTPLDSVGIFSVTKI